MRVPYRAAGAWAGGWIGEGAAIPVESFTLGAVSLVPHKVSAISTFSGELRKHSNPSIETVVGAALQSDLGHIVDAALVDDQAATSLRPAGLRNGVAGLTPSASADPDTAMRADLRTLAAAVIAAGGTSPIFITNPLQGIGLGFAVNNSFPAVISSAGLPGGTVIAVDAASFASAIGPALVDASRDATVHEEDAVPLPLATGPQGSAVMAAPIRSMFQTDTVGLRCLLDATWAIPPGRAQWMQGVVW